jgi:hypothetical protein
MKHLAHFVAVEERELLALKHILREMIYKLTFRKNYPKKYILRRFGYFLSSCSAYREANITLHVLL